MPFPECIFGTMSRGRAPSLEENCWAESAAVAVIAELVLRVKLPIFMRRLVPVGAVRELRAALLERLFAGAGCLIIDLDEVNVVDSRVLAVAVRIAVGFAAVTLLEVNVLGDSSRPIRPSPTNCAAMEELVTPRTVLLSSLVVPGEDKIFRPKSGCTGSPIAAFVPEFGLRAELSKSQIHKSILKDIERCRSVIVKCINVFHHLARCAMEATWY